MLSQRQEITKNSPRVRQEPCGSGLLCRDAGTAIEETAEIVEPGMSELEITGALAAETYDRGLAPIVVLVATDERVSRYRHPIPTAGSCSNTPCWSCAPAATAWWPT